MPRKLRQTGTPWRHLVKLVPAEWWPDFTVFVQTGEARAEYLEFLERDANCRLACDLVLNSDTLVAGFTAALSLATGRDVPSDSA